MADTQQIVDAITGLSITVVSVGAVLFGGLVYIASQVIPYVKREDERRRHESELRRAEFAAETAHVEQRRQG